MHQCVRPIWPTARSKLVYEAVIKLSRIGSNNFRVATILSQADYYLCTMCLKSISEDEFIERL